MAYRWNGSGPLRRSSEPGDWVYPGDEFEPSEAERRSFGDVMSEVEEEPDSEPEPEPDGSEENGDADDAVYHTNDDGEPLCAGTKADDEPCTRTVDELGGYCYQHGPD